MSLPRSFTMPAFPTATGTERCRSAMAIALITLSDAGARLLAPLAAHLPEARVYVHTSVRKEAISLAPAGSDSSLRASDAGGDNLQLGPNSRRTDAEKGA